MGAGKNKTSKTKQKNIAKTQSGGTKKVNPWLVHVKKFREANPDLKFKDVLMKAKETYKKN